jgi:hypothetical protein
MGYAIAPGWADEVPAFNSFFSPPPPPVRCHAGAEPARRWFARAPVGGLLAECSLATLISSAVSTGGAADSQKLSVNSLQTIMVLPRLLRRTQG